MMRLRSLALGLACLLAACNQAKAPQPGSPEEFKVRLGVEPAKGGDLQRLILPGQALAAMESSTAADVRLFDGAGRALPLVLDGHGVAAGGAREKATLAAVPVMGSSTPRGGVSISIDADKVGHVVTIGTDGAPVQGPARVVAALIDTRALKEPVAAIVLDADLPMQRPVTMTFESSRDLATWDYLGEKVLFRPSQGSEVLGNGQANLGGAELKDRYLRITWGDAEGVTIKGATLTTARYAPPPQVSIATSGMVLDDAHNARFSPPFATPLAGITLIENGPDGIVPVKVYGRELPEQEWRLLGTGTVKPGEKGSKIDLWAMPEKEYRIEADKRSAGFASAPRLALLLDPIALIGAFNGNPPYTLAVGSKGAKANFFVESELVPSGTDAATLPLARVGGAEAEVGPVMVTPEGPASPFSPRKLALWGALLLGTAVLTLAAIKLLRSNAPAKDQAGS